MLISVEPDLELALNNFAKRAGLTAEALARNTLRERFLTTACRLEPQDDWERLLSSAATECGVSLSNASLGREEMYD